MVLDAQFARSKDKRPHPMAPELVGGVELSSRALRSSAHGPVTDLITNAEYWLNFELASFEALLSRSPSPLRELGVGVVLRYGEGVDGRLDAGDLLRARSELLDGLPPPLAEGIGAGLDVLGRAVEARLRIDELEAAGHARYVPSTGLSIHGLRAGGRAQIWVDDQKADGDVTLSLGRAHVLKATDDRGRPLSAPEIESETGAPIWARALEKNEGRSVVVLVPGRYRVRVPGRAEAVRTLLAR